MILVFGSLNMDLVIQVPALPRPGQTVIAPAYVTKLGGKGNNQAIAAARAGAEVMMVGAVGGDDFGDQILASLTANGVAAAGVRRVEERTGLATICVDPEGTNFITVAAGANARVSADWVPEPSLHMPGTTVLLQMEVPLEQNWSLIRHARECGALTVLNLAPMGEIPRPVLDQLDVLIVNEKEAAPLAEMLGLPAEDPTGLARAVADTTKTTCVVTLGAAGAIAARPGEVWRVGSLSIQAVDTTGAGDAFTGVLAASLDDDIALPDALHRAAAAGGLVCEQLGAQESLPTTATIDEAVARLAPPVKLG